MLSLFVPSVIIVVTAIIFIPTTSTKPSRRPYPSPGTSPSSSISTKFPILSLLLRRRVLCHALTRVDPIAVHVDRGTQIVDRGLEALAADLAVQLADAELLVKFHLDRFFVVAEEAGECCCKGFTLFRTLGFAGGLLAFSLGAGISLGSWNMDRKDGYAYHVNICAVVELGLVGYSRGKCSELG